MAGAGKRGPDPLTAQPEEYVRLIGAGVSNSEACRRVGINRRTGTRWRFGRTVRDVTGEPVHYPAVCTSSRKPGHSRYLSLEERATIADLHRANTSLREIADAIGRAPSTVSRELRRNISLGGRYSPEIADRLAAGRLTRPRARRVSVDEDLRGVVVELLGKRWSPEQVAHELPDRFPGQVARHLCVESIYQAIYDPGADLTRPAKRRRRRRRRRVQGWSVAASSPR